MFASINSNVAFRDIYCDSMQETLFINLSRIFLLIILSTKNKSFGV